MPVVRLAYPKGALTQEQKRQLAADLTDIVLDAEVDAITASGKMVAQFINPDVGADRRAEISAAIRRPEFTSP